jgi:ribosomal protein L37AE/L43A
MKGMNMICPVCGSDMQELSPQVWRCKCGHRKIAKTSKQEKTEKEAKEVYRKRFWDESKRVRKSISHRKEIVDRKKRTSV